MLREIEERLYQHCLQANFQLIKLLNPSNVQPRSEPALELNSRAGSSVGVMHCSSGPNTGSHPGGRRILKNKKQKTGFSKLVLRF